MYIHMYIYMYILHYITVYVEKRGPCECLLVAYEELVCPKMLKVGCPTALQQICPKKIPFSQNSQGRVHCDIIVRICTPYFTGPFQRGPSCCRSHIVRHQVPAPGSQKFIHEICGHLFVLLMFASLSAAMVSDNSHGSA